MILIIPFSLAIGFLAWKLRPGKDQTKAGWIAMFAVILPAVALAIAAVIFQLVHNAAGIISVAEPANTLFVAGLILIGLGLLAMVGFAMAAKKEIVKNIGFGLCLAFFTTVVELGLLEWLGGV